MATVQVRANYDFGAENEAELSFALGDIITVLNQDDEGWWEGELNGQRGLFPSNYVEVLKTGPPLRPTATLPPAPQLAGFNGSSRPSQKFSSPPFKQTDAGAVAQVAQYQFTSPGAPAPYQDQAAATDYQPIADQPFSQGNTQATGDFVKPVKQPADQKSPSGTVIKDHSVDVSPAQFRRVQMPPSSKTKFGYFASNMAYWSGWCCIFLGPLAILWGLVTTQYYGVIDVIVGVYNIILGFAILVFEAYWGETRRHSKVPTRGLIYIAVSIFTFFSNATVFNGAALVIVGITNIVATALGESYEETKRVAPSAVSSVHIQSGGFFSSAFSWVLMVKEQNKFGTLVFLAIFFAGNIAIFFATLAIWIQMNQDLPPAARFSNWAPYAKAFGATLDINAAVILLPVCRTILRWLYNKSTADQTIVARMLRAILYFIPIDRNIAFHKLVAKMIMFGSVTHTVTHFVNYGLSPDATINFFRVWTFVTGGVIMLAMLFIFGGAPENVRRGQFEIFWYSHHWFTVFIVFTILHGSMFFNPNFWKYIIVPGFLYIVERCLRYYRSKQKVVVLSITNMDDVLSLEFAKEGIFQQPYKEGQYIFLQSPAISGIQWHPFTISSAPEEATVTVHIRVLGEGSWTRGLKDYVSSMGPRSRAFFQLDRQGPNGKLMGKILGPDAKPILCIDGPHSAPTQHISEYSTVFVIGAGIGVTPVAATLKSVVFHKWKYFIGQCFPDHAYFVWVCAHKDIDAFRWLIRTIKDAQDEVCHMRATNPGHMATKTFEFHIYVSSVPKDQRPVDVVVDDEIGFWGVPREDAKVEKVRCNWDEADLYKTMMCPQPHTALADVHVWNGRPQWDPRFNDISTRTSGGDIGVTFCGNPIIAKDLTKYCHIHSRTRKNGLFVLHKENF